jgi:hypothetical protein
MSFNYLRNALKNYHKNSVKVYYHKKTVFFSAMYGIRQSSEHGRKGQTSQKLLTTTPTLRNLG